MFLLHFSLDSLYVMQIQFIIPVSNLKPSGNTNNSDNGCFVGGVYCGPSSINSSDLEGYSNMGEGAQSSSQRFDAAEVNEGGHFELGAIRDAKVVQSKQE